MAYDPRCIANYVLDCAKDDEVVVTHLALQKLIYFAHGMYLINIKEPLVTGYFEAWPHGPVHPVLYDAFKSAGRTPICFRAEHSDVFTGELKQIAPLKDLHAKKIIRRVVDSLGQLSPSTLRDISHVKDSPWASVTANDPVGKEGRGARIDNLLIAERFVYHKLSVGRESDKERIFETSYTTEIRPRTHSTS